MCKDFSLISSFFDTDNHSKVTYQDQTILTIHKNKLMLRKVKEDSNYEQSRKYFIQPLIDSKLPNLLMYWIERIVKKHKFNIKQVRWSIGIKHSLVYNFTTEMSEFSNLNY